MARYQVILAYDGTLFLGFQRQSRTRTVQGVVEAALGALGWTGRTIYSAGRTDTGVHAAGQVIAFDLEWKHSTLDLRQALNANLPEDVAAREVREVPPDFHPRYGALSRRYQYRILCSDVRDPLRERYVWRARLVPVPTCTAVQVPGTFFRATE
jgi:tRNA pseudouridine38-40 synthase